MYQDLKNKVAVVTGGSKGIGNAIVKRFGQEQMSVVINYNGDQESAQKAAVDVKVSGGKAVVVKADVATEEGNAAILKAALDNFGDLDIWVNNAGMEIKKPTHEVSLADWNKVISVNQTGVFLGSKIAINYFKSHRKPGNIINIVVRS